jgi:mercuric ion transport protein
MQTIEFKIGGLHCEACAKLNRMSLNDLGGVLGTNIDIKSGVAQITFDENQTNAWAIKNAIIKNGYTIKD